ncbi:MAG: polysaccharide biosynthesis tyrosine autokinase [Pyrinomonadaceae bacterium]
MKETREILVAPPIEKIELEKHFEPNVSTGNGRYPAYRGLYDQEGSQFIEYWRAIRKRLWLVIGIVVLFTTLTAIYMARRPNIFQAQAVIQVDLEQANPNLVTDERRKPSLTSDPAYFNTQLQLLTSEGLLRRVVKEYSLDTNKEFIKDKGEASVSPFRSVLKAIGLVRDENAQKSDGIEEISEDESLSSVSTEEMAEAVRLAPYVDVIKKNLTVEPVRETRGTVKDTRLIDVYYRHTSPELAAFIVNGISQVFTKQNQDKRSGTSRKTNVFLDERIANLQSEIKAGEEKLVALNRVAGIVRKDDQTTIDIDRLTGLNKQLLDSEENRKTAESKFNAINNSSDRLNALVEVEMQRYITERENDVRRSIIESQRDISKLNAERAKFLEEYQASAPEIKEIDQQIGSLKTDINSASGRNTDDLQKFRASRAKVILDNFKREYLQAKETEEKVRASFNQQYVLAQGQDQSAVSIRLLQQDIETKRGFLQNLENQLRANDIESLGTDNNISQVEVAIPPDKPVAPSRLTSVLAALFLSTMFGAGLALFLEYLDDTIRSTEDIEKYLGLPALAAIPSIESIAKRRLLLVGGNEEAPTNQSTELLIHTDTRSSIAEAYRQLRTSILLSTAGHAPKSLLVTSSLPAEGKTTTATNTAISLAQTGAKVLIIDADMRRPRLHSVFNISNAEGLSTVLSTALSKEEVLNVIQFDDAANLYLLPSGPVPPNPAELIGSEQMASVFKLLQEEFTHVVVDSPPIASFTDGVLIASMVDGVILVVHSGKSSRQVVRRSRQLLQDVGAKVFGVVLNKVNLRSQDNYYYYQSYYHRSNYRHENEEDEQ